jgi:molybdenum cofactor cytidylyltransferase
MEPGGLVYDCIIPAAGASSRMGAWKPGLPFRDGTILQSVAEAALGAGCRVLVVAGNRADSIPEALGACLASFVEVVFNPHWREGMMGSLQTGMSRVRSTRFFVLPADMPFAPPRAFRELVREAEIRQASGLPDAPFFPMFHGMPGHPVLIPSCLIAEALRLPRESRLKDFLQSRYPVFVAVNHPGVCSDLDTRRQYEDILPDV